MLKQPSERQKAVQGTASNNHKSGVTHTTYTDMTHTTHTDVTHTAFDKQEGGLIARKAKKKTVMSYGVI